MENTQTPIPVAKTAGAYGVRGSVRIVPYETGEALLAASRWFLIDREGGISSLTVQSVKPHANALIAKFEGIDSKEAADALRGAIGILREDFPAAGEGRYWAVDIVDSTVVNREGLVLGRVTGFDSNGVQDILVVLDAEGRRHLIPMVSAYVDAVDTRAKTVRVDWQPDWS